jgi:hypothetical protein
MAASASEAASRRCFMLVDLVNCGGVCGKVSGGWGAGVNCGAYAGVCCGLVL